eukprot:scaffold12316_cov113-Isochrysis_galbana.AAC.1
MIAASGNRRANSSHVQLRIVKPSERLTASLTTNSDPSTTSRSKVEVSSAVRRGMPRAEATPSLLPPSPP